MEPYKKSGKVAEAVKKEKPLQGDGNRDLKRIKKKMDRLNYLPNGGCLFCHRLDRQ